MKLRPALFPSALSAVLFASAAFVSCRSAPLDEPVGAAEGELNYCGGSVCAIGQEACCDGRCTPVVNVENNCGACGNACGEHEV